MNLFVVIKWTAFHSTESLIIKSVHCVLCSVQSAVWQNLGIYHHQGGYAFTAVCVSVSVSVQNSGVFHHLTVATRSTKLSPCHTFISLFGVNLCILVYQNLPESDGGCFCGNRLGLPACFLCWNAWERRPGMHVNGVPIVNKKALMLQEKHAMPHLFFSV